jgi:hypothetical protein
MGVKPSSRWRRWGRRPRAYERLIWAAALASAFGSTGAAAAPERAVPPCSRGQQSALSEIACEIADGLAASAAGATLASAPLQSDVPVAAPAPALARLLDVVAGRVRASSVVAEATALGAALGKESRGTKLVYLSPQIARGELRVVADVYSPTRGFWDRVKRMIAPPEAHVFSSRRLDAELHTFLPPVPLVAEQVVRSRSPEARPVSVACGDLDADGTLELALIGRQRIALGRIRSGRVVTHRSAEWSALSGVAPSPLREPLASSALETGRYLDVGSSDRSEAVRLAPDLTALARLGPKLPWPGGGCASRRGLAALGAPEPWLAGDPTPRARPLTGATDAVAGAVIVRRDGSARVVRAAREADTNRVVVSDDSGRTAHIEGAGAQLAVADLDFDGQPEIATSLDGLDPAADAVVVYTWSDAGAISERWRTSVPHGVLSLAICPPEDGGRAAVLVGIPGGVWLIR